MASKIPDYQSQSEDEDVITIHHGKGKRKRRLIDWKVMMVMTDEEMAMLIEHWERLSQGRKCRRFDDLVEICNHIYVLSGMTEEDPLKSRCTCRVNMKKHLCKHVVGVAIQLGYLNPPSQAKTVPIGKKRPRGRPAKAKKAKIVQ